MTIKITCVPDEELEKLAEQKGEGSVEAHVLKKVRLQRTKDRQAMPGPAPDAKTEQLMIELAEDLAEEIALSMLWKVLCRSDLGEHVLGHRNSRR